VRNDLMQRSRVPEKPNDTFNRFSSISWSTVSNAALTSKRAKGGTGTAGPKMSAEKFL